MADTKQQFAAYDEWQRNPGRLTKNAFIDTCGGCDPRGVARWIESPFGKLAREIAAGL